MELWTTQIGDLVTSDFRIASLFQEAGLDFCCGGRMTLQEACEKKGISLVSICEKIEKLKMSEPDSSKNFKEWDLGFMCDYIVNTHHKYVLKTLPELLFYTEKIASVHGGRHSELVEIATLFSEINRELSQHLKNEEEVLFPAIKDIIKGKSAASAGIIINEIARMTAEHEFAGGAMDRINEMTDNYSVPDDGCNTYSVAFRTLKQFEDDLHIHVHLENNILYPGALKIANQ